MGRLRVGTIAALALLAGCKFLDPTSGINTDFDTDFDIEIPDLSFPEGGYIGPEGTIEIGEKAGETCSGTSDCRPGLSCSDGTCEPAGDTAADDPCVLSAECADGFTCGFPAQCWDDARTSDPPSNPFDCGLAACLPSGDVQEGDPCALPEDCAAGLRCNLVGFGGVCEPEGQADIAQECTSHADCRDPLLCAPPSELTGTETFTCQIPAAVADQLFMPPVECEQIPDERDFAVFFEVPGEEPPDEFYRLPFPNDIRLRDGHVDMSGHHNPGLVYVGGALVDLYLDAAERLSGFSTNPAVFFRFTHNPDFTTFSGSGDDPTVNFVDIDPDSPQYGARRGMQWTLSTGGGKFICPRFMAVRPGWSSPLAHGTTYAVYLTDGIIGGGGEAPVVEPDFAAMLDDTEPQDPRLAAAWPAYAPLRSYFADSEIDPSRVIAAAVFTTMDPDRDTPALREAVRAQPAPSLRSVTRCGASVTGPCDDGERGACVNPSADVWEIHATYEAPVFQAGTRPYLLEEDGGDVQVVDGAAVVQDTETICLSLTVPKTEMPDGGWPVVLFGHGTGGSFTSHISGGTAGAVAAIDLGDQVVRMASVGIDGPQHGPRRGESDLDPEPLFYNFANPRSAVGNVQQGAADFFTLVQLLEVFDQDIDGVGPVRFDTDNLFYFGHSQGATTGALFAAYEPLLSAVVFSGQGGGLVLSLLNKTSPQDIAGGVEFVLTDGGRSGGTVTDSDPLLSLLQMVVDPVDPLNYARLYSREPADPEGSGMDVLQSYGFGDTYAPEPTQEAFAKATGLALPIDADGELGGFTELDYPISGNRSANGAPVTAVVIPVDPAGDYDGHFVIFRDADLKAQSMEYLGTAVRDGVPTVSAP